MEYFPCINSTFTETVKRQEKSGKMPGTAFEWALLSGQFLKKSVFCGRDSLCSAFPYELLSMDRG
jgi:hypothetical protein